MIDLGMIAAIGGTLLVIVLVFAVIRNQRRSDADRRRTDEATRNLYARTDREDKASDPDMANY